MTSFGSSTNLGKQSSKPMIGVGSSSSRPASGRQRPIDQVRDPRTSHYQGELASSKYQIGDKVPIPAASRKGSAKAAGASIKTTQFGIQESPSPGARASGARGLTQMDIMN